MNRVLFRAEGNDKAFTLVELLIVVALISVLSSITFLIINPSNLIKKSREAVLKSNMSKLCSALFSCATYKGNAAECAGSFNSIGVTQPTEPAGASYNPPRITSGGVVEIVGSLDSCVYRCGFDFVNGNSINLPSAPPLGCVQ